MISGAPGRSRTSDQRFRNPERSAVDSTTCATEWAPSGQREAADLPTVRVGRVRGLSLEEWDRIADLFGRGDVVPRDALWTVCRSEVTSIAVVLCLLADGLCRAEWLAYHTCSDAAVTVRSFEAGFLGAGPCPGCGEDVGMSGYRYDLRCVDCRPFRPVEQDDEPEVTP